MCNVIDLGATMESATVFITQSQFLNNKFESS